VLGIYLHVPFCHAICNYCNFNRGLLDEDLKRRYVRALIQDIDRGGDGSGADTIYFGGGTPSVLEPEEVGAIVSACRRAFGLEAEAEVTLEVNPETVTGPRLAGFRQAGVNRLSLGVQSFHDEELRRLGRLHDATRAREALRLARAAGFDNVSLDLMMWLPGQTLDAWLASVEALIEAGPDHASLYLLEIYPNAPLRDEMARGGWTQEGDEVAAAMYLRGLARLDAAGYGQYEISNVARSGRRSRHNLKYWTDGDWAAFGCGAHGTREGVRSRLVAGTAEYVALVERGADVRAEVRVLSRDDRLAEALIMGLRLNDGVDLDALRDRYGIDPRERFGAGLAPFLDAGLAVVERARLRLTREGFLLSNEIMAVFV
jgi:oxygen-independent coproporphyrinogen-3 oxidase